MYLFTSKYSKGNNFPTCSLSVGPLRESVQKEMAAIFVFPTVWKLAKSNEHRNALLYEWDLFLVEIYCIQKSSMTVFKYVSGF